MQAVQTKEPTLEQVNQAITAILETLGNPESDLHNKALAAFQSSDRQTVKSSIRVMPETVIRNR